MGRSAGVPANGSCRANTDPKSPRIGAACGCFSKGNLPRRRSGNRSSPTSCCAWKRRCTAAPAPRCATFVSLSRDGFFTMKNDGWVSTRSFHPVFFIGRVFSRDSSGTRKKAVFAIAARNRLRRRGRRLDRAMRDGERVRHSRRRTPASADRRVEPGIEPRTRRGRTDFSSTHHRNPPRDDVFFANTR